MQRTDQNPNGIIVLTEDSMPQLARCDSTLSKWAKRGILVPIRRHGSLYYRLSDVMKVYNGEL